MKQHIRNTNRKSSLVEIRDLCMITMSDLSRYFHRLRGNASPMLTETHNSMGASRDFLTFFPAHLWRWDPKTIFTQNGSDDVHSRKDVPFAVIIATFHTPWSPGPLGQNFVNFWSCKFFARWPLTTVYIRGPEKVHGVHPLFFIGAQWKWHSK